MAKKKPSPKSKSTKKRKVDAAGLDNGSTPRGKKDDVSDQNNSFTTDRKEDPKTKETENNNSENTDDMSDANSQASKKAEADNVSIGSSDPTDTKLPSAEKATNHQPPDSHEEDEKKKATPDSQSSARRPRRVKPSEKLRMQQELEDDDDDADEMESDVEESWESRKSKKRKTSFDDGSLQYKKTRLKKLDKDEEKEVLERAYQRGLPEGWLVAYHRDWKRKVWISPDETRIVDSIPRAIAISEKKATEEGEAMGDVDDGEAMEAEDGANNDKAVDATEAAAGNADEDEDDDDDGDNKGGPVKVANSFVTLKKGPVEGTDPASLFIAASEDLHEMCEKLEKAALKKGRAKGLRDPGWRCVWNSRFRRKNWVSPHGRLFGNLSRAVEKQDDWVIKQEKKKMKANKKLQEIEEEWQKQFKRLLKYKRRHGDTLVPDHYERYPELPAWVRKQRRQYLRSQQGGKSSITPEQIEELNKIGFQWVVEKVPKRSSKKQAAVVLPSPATTQQQEVMLPPPPEGSIFDNAPEEMSGVGVTRRHVLFSEMQPPPVPPARVPIKFVNPVRKLPNGSLGTESYCREVEQYLKTWYGAGQII